MKGLGDTQTMPIEEEETGTFQPRDKRIISVVIMHVLHTSSFFSCDLICQVPVRTLCRLQMRKQRYRPAEGVSFWLEVTWLA